MRDTSFSSRRSTTRSPCPVGSVETRTSMARPPTRSVMRPSCGRRFSAMSIAAMILMRDTSAACSARLGRTTSRSVPSTRKRTSDDCSKGSMWISEAPSRAACVSRALIMRMIGASSSVSSRSSISGTSCIMRVMSISPSMSPTTCCAESSGREYVWAMASASSLASTTLARTRPGNARSTSLSASMPVDSVTQTSASRSPWGLSRMPLSRANAYGTYCCALVMALAAALLPARPAGSRPAPPRRPQAQAQAAAAAVPAACLTAPDGAGAPTGSARCG